MNINDFVSRFNNFARPTLYRVTASDILNQDFQFLCKAATLPASVMGEVEVPYMGRKIKIAGDRQFENWSLTVMNDESFAIRKQFEDWSNYINGNVTNLTSGTIASYKKVMQIESLGQDGATLVTYEMRGAWPSNISAIDMGMENSDSIQEYTVDISYDEWNRI